MTSDGQVKTISGGHRFARGGDTGLARRAKLGLLMSALFFYLYGVHFTFFPTYTSRIIVVLAWAYLALLLCRSTDVRISRELFSVSMLYFSWFAWVLLRTAQQGASDISILISVALLGGHAFVGGLFFALAFSRLNWTFRDLVFGVQVIITVQAMFVVLYFLSWDFREFTFRYIPEVGNIDYRENLFRSRGFTHGSGARLSLIQSFGLLFTAYLISSISRRHRHFYYLLFSFGLIFVSIVLTGRTGLLMVPLVALYLVAVVGMRLRLTRGITKFSVGIPIAIVVSYLALKLGYEHLLGGFTTASGEDGLNRLLRWVTSEFIRDGELQSRTWQILQGHWFIPNDWRVLMFGDPATWELNRIPSDIGVVRMLFGIGMVGTTIGYCLFLTIILSMVRHANGVESRLMLAIFGGFLILAEAKEPFLLDLNVNSFLLMLFCSLVVLGRAQGHSVSKILAKAAPADERGWRLVGHKAAPGDPTARA